MITSLKEFCYLLFKLFIFRLTEIKTHIHYCIYCCLLQLFFIFSILSLCFITVSPNQNLKYPLLFDFAVLNNKKTKQNSLTISFSTFKVMKKSLISQKVSDDHLKFEWLFNIRDFFFFCYSRAVKVRKSHFHSFCLLLLLNLPSCCCYLVLFNVINMSVGVISAAKAKIYSYICFCKKDCSFNYL